MSENVGFGGRTYRAVGRRINANPATRETESGKVTSVGFPLCDLSDYVDEQVAADIVEILNSCAELSTLRAQNAAMKEAIEAVRDGYKSQMKFCDIEALGYFREFVRRIDNALAQVAK